ncbi:MAG: multifunctional CCA addition/repair protein [Acidiferrobacteraceae bacterium]|nr:multifunctional CCA addition/repair protein [Acidiferrobacteraceae bacterium]
MNKFLVGGAVRDKLLGKPTEDRDWVVIGTTSEALRTLGFKQVGKDFPVFLHPVTHEEYALARRERKVAPGYHGFDIDTSSSVSLEEDLARRDLTINAMAETVDGQLIDPFNGASDLKARVLRHVSSAFSEDPVRVLRLARFASRFADLGFTVAAETGVLVSEMAQAGELNTLAPERVWKELELALAENHPATFFQVLRDNDALLHILPEIDALFGVPQPENHHPEGDAGIHTMMALEAAASLTSDTRVRFATLVHDLGKALTPKSEWPSHRNHERIGIRQVTQFCQRLRIPRRYSELAIVVTGNHLLMHRLPELRSTTILKLLEALNAFQQPENIQLFALACQADADGRGLKKKPYPAADLLLKYANAARAVNLEDLAQRFPNGKARSREARRRRVSAIAEVRSIWRGAQ